MNKDFLTKFFWVFWIGLLILQTYATLTGY